MGSSTPVDQPSPPSVSEVNQPTPTNISPTCGPCSTLPKVLENITTEINALSKKMASLQEFISSNFKPAPPNDLLDTPHPGPTAEVDTPLLPHCAKSSSTTQQGPPTITVADPQPSSASAIAQGPQLGPHGTSVERRRPRPRQSKQSLNSFPPRRVLLPTPPLPGVWIPGQEPTFPPVVHRDPPYQYLPPSRKSNKRKVRFGSPPKPATSLRNPSSHHSSPSQPYMHGCAAGPIASTRPAAETNSSTTSSVPSTHSEVSQSPPFQRTRNFWASRYPPSTSSPSTSSLETPFLATRSHWSREIPNNLN